MAYEKINWKNGETKLSANNFDIMDKGIKEINLAGIINIYAGETAPNGWLVCDGSEISRTEYSNLFEIIGELYGTGDNETTFNLPNLKGRVVVGLNDEDTDFGAMNKKDGAKTHTLTIAQMPNHSHEIQLGISEGASTGRYAAYVDNGRLAWNTTDNKGTALTGGNESHNNLQPYIVLNYIIKY